MKYPFSSLQSELDSAVYCIQKVLKYYHVTDEIHTIKQFLMQYNQSVSTQSIIHCLHQYMIEANEVTTNLENSTLPCILYSQKLNTYLFISKKNKKYFMADTPDFGIYKIPLSNIKEFYSGTCIQIHHVGRLKRNVKHTSFFGFLRRMILQEKYAVFQNLKYTIASSFILLLQFIIIIKMEKYPWLLSGSTIFILSNIQIVLRYFQKNRNLVASQKRLQTYGEDMLLNISSNGGTKIQNEQVVALLHDIEQWYQVFCGDGILWLSIFLLSTWKYQYIAISMHIIITIVCGLYKHRCSCIKKEKNITLPMYDDWNSYLQNRRDLHQLQYYESHISQLHSNSITMQKEYCRQVKKRYVSEGVFGVLALLLILGVIGVWYLLLQTKSILFFESIAIIILIFYQIQTTWKIFCVVQNRQECNHLFTIYKEILEYKKTVVVVKLPITSVRFVHVRGNKLDFLSLDIEQSLALQGGQKEIQEIISLVMGDYLPYQGKIYFNDQIATKELFLTIQKRIILLTEHPVFFEGSIRSHLINSPLLEHEMSALLQIFKMEEIASRLDEMLYPHSKSLTLAQRQLMRIIRAVLLKPDILILQEALSAVELFVYDKVILYLQTCLTNTIVIIVDSLHRKLPLYYQKIIVKDGNIVNRE